MIAFVVLAITLGSLLAAGLPLLTALIGVGIGVAGADRAVGLRRALGDGAHPCHDARPGGGDRLRAVHPLPPSPEHGRRAGSTREAAAQATCNRRKRRRVNGATVVIALVGLTVVNIPFLSVMGLAAAGTVTIAVLIAHHVAARVARLRRQLRVDARQPRARVPAAAQPGEGGASRETASTRWARFVTAASAGRPGGVRPDRAVHRLPCRPCTWSWACPTAARSRRRPPSGAAYDLVTDGFGPGFNRPLTAVVDAPGRRRKTNGDAPRTGVFEGIQDLPGVAAISQPMQNEAGRRDDRVGDRTTSGGPASRAPRTWSALLREKADEVHEGDGHRGVRDGTTPSTSTRPTLAGGAAEVRRGRGRARAVAPDGRVPLGARAVKAAAGFLLSIAASMGIVVSVSRTATWPTCLASPRPGRS